ncbi:MAG: hypothetical protein PHV03_07300 [Desulfitobacteriaceae bacterium]|nr:hypothetical protein [Desulfitobacteriaceae bacterium]
MQLNGTNSQLKSFQQLPDFPDQPGELGSRYFRLTEISYQTNSDADKTAFSPSFIPSLTCQGGGWFGNHYYD